MTVFATVGYPGCGKGEVATVAHVVGVPVVTMGDVVRRECRSRGLMVTEHNLGQVASLLREADGNEAIATRTLPLVNAVHRPYPVVLIDGIRGASEVACFRSAIGDAFALIAVEAPFSTRLERIKQRGRDISAISRDDLVRRDRRERGYGMDDAIGQADYTIENDDTLEHFHDRVRRLLLEKIEA